VDETPEAEVEEAEAAEPESPPEKRPPHTSHVELYVDTKDEAVTRSLAFANLLRAVDEIQGEDVRKKGVEFLDAMLAGAKRDKLTVVQGSLSRI